MCGVGENGRRDPLKDQRYQFNVRRGQKAALVVKLGGIRFTYGLLVRCGLAVSGLR